MRKHRIIIAFCIATTLLCIASCSGESKEERVKRLGGNAIIETGEIAAVNYRGFTVSKHGSFWMEMKIIGILEHGAIVNVGDSILQLDPTEVKKLIINWEDKLETELTAMETLKVNQDNKKSDQEARMKTEIASFNLKKVELESSRFEADRIKKIKELEFKQAEINLDKEKRRLELNAIIDANDYKIQKIRIEQVQNYIKSLYDIIPQLTIRTPINGVFQIARSRRNGNLRKIGDELYPGELMASVPELKWMRIETSVNETDFLRVRVGQKVLVRLDAMPEVSFDGEVQYMSKLCRLKDEKSRQKIFDVEIKMMISDERLKPGMTVSCEYLEN